MFKLVILLTIATCALGAVVPDGILPQNDNRIVGGSTIPISTAPWAVSIQRDGVHVCGGSVYNTNHIVTAAHCVAGSTTNSLKVRARSSYTDRGGQLVAVYNFKYHEGYNPVTMENDIAVLRLTIPITYDINYRNLDLAYSTPANGAIAYATGWGSLTFGGTKSDALQQVAVNVISEYNCASNVYGYGNEIKSTMLCAAAFGKDTCQDDAGGTLASGGYLVGIVSWGYGCAYSNYPGVYTNVAVLRSWIISAASSI